MADRVVGVRTLGMSTDREGNRSYTVRYLVKMDDPDDGPAAVVRVSGLPQFGDQYSDGKSDSDPWAFCTFESEVARHEEADGEVGYYWSVDKTFTTVSPRGRDLSRMAAANPGNASHPPGKGEPTDQQANPPQVSISFVRYTEEAVTDYLDGPILNSAHEFIRGQKNEWDMNRVQVKIKQAVTADEIQFPALVNMVDTVNSLTLWGFPPRTIKLSEAPVEFRWHSNGQPYFDRSLTFDIRYRARQTVTSVLTPGTGTALLEELVQDEYFETWDRYVMDEGTKVLNGRWGAKGSGLEKSWILLNVNGAAPDPANPKHFVKMTDDKGNPTRVLLDGGGLPADTVVVVSTGSGGVPDETTLAPVGRRLIKFYGQSDFSKIPHLPTSLFPLVVP